MKSTAPYKLAQIRPMPGWSLCESLIPTNKTSTGLEMVRPGDGMERGKVTEAVVRVIAVTPQVADDGIEVPTDFQAGDLLIIRDFLKFANPVGNLVGADKDYRYFLLSNKDAVCVVSGSGSIGHYNEFVLE
jgi:hypothetical protein